MNLFDDNSPPPPDQDPSSPFPAETGTGTSPPLSIPAAPPLAGDPISLAATDPPAVASYSLKPSLPEDLRISWSWLHLVLFLFFGFFSLILIQGGFAIYYAPLRHFANEKEFCDTILNSS